MYRTMMKSKIHRATVTQADLHYVGSLTVCTDLMEAAGLLPGEKVDVMDVNNGARLSTYLISGPPGSGIIGVNGPSARLITPGDLVVVIAYALISDEELPGLEPHVVFVDERNRVTDTGTDPAEAPPGSGLLRGDLVTD